MEVFVFRGLPGSPALRVARSLFTRPVDRIVDLTRYYETSQGNLFMTESIPDEGKEAIRQALRAEEISRLAVCATCDKGWVSQVLEEEGVDPDSMHWLVVEGAAPPERAPRKLYKRLERTFEIDLTR